MWHQVKAMVTEPSGTGICKRGLLLESNKLDSLVLELVELLLKQLDQQVSLTTEDLNAALLVTLEVSCWHSYTAAATRGTEAKAILQRMRNSAGVSRSPGDSSPPPGSPGTSSDSSQN